MERCSRSRHSPSQSTLDSNRRKCSGRFPFKTRHGQLGTLSGQKDLHLCGGAFLRLSESGCFRLPLVSPAPALHVLVQGQSGLGSGCPDESSHLSLPSCSASTQGDQEGERGEDSSSVDMPILADSPVVGSADGHVGGASHAPSSLQEHRVPLHFGGENSLSRPLGGTSHFRQAFALSTASYDLDQDDIEFLSNHVSSGTATGYGYVFEHFKSFCETLQAGPLTCSPAVIVKYMFSIAL